MCVVRYLFPCLPGKREVRWNTFIIGCFQAVAGLLGFLLVMLQQETRSFKQKSEEPTSLYIDQIFWLNITICCGQALLGILLIVATFGRKGVLKTLAYPWIPITGVLTLTFFILQWLAWNGKIRYWNSYYENYYLNLHPEKVADSIFPAIVIFIMFSFFSLVVWAFIKTDYKNSGNLNQSIGFWQIGYGQDQ